VKIHQLGWVLCCILSVATLASAQTATTSLRGTVKDPSGALVPGASVTLVNKAIGKTYSAVSNSDGYYAFQQIQPARYVITVAAAGFSNQTKTAELLVNQPATVDFMLSVQANQTTVDVSDTAQTLNTSDATVGDSIGSVTIESLPMEGRDPVSLLTLQPGVLYLGNPQENSVQDSRSGSVSGGRSDQGNIMLDGMDDNDQISGTAFQGVLRSTLDSTEEFRVTTSNGSADSGRSSGAQISLVTKSGTNSFHGALYEYYRPTNTVANQWFYKYTELSQGEPNIPQKYVMNTFGGSLGGPIKKDKLFFFFNYEGQRKAIDDVVTRTLPTAQFYQGQLGYLDNSGNPQWLNSTQVSTLDAGCSPANAGSAPGLYNAPCGPNPNVTAYYQPVANNGFYGTAPTTGDTLNSAGYIFASPAPSTLNTSIAKIDYNINNQQHIFFRGNLQKDTSAGDKNLPGQPAATMHIDNTKGLAFGHTWTPSSKIVNDVRYAFVRQGYSTHGVGSGTGDWVFFRAYSQPTAWQNRSTVVNVPVQNIADNFSWIKGAHTISAGGDWRNVENNRSSDANSYSSTGTDAGWLDNAPNDPSMLGASNPSVGAGFENSYSIAYNTMIGAIPKTIEQYNYAVTGPSSGTLYPDGAFINRHFKAYEYEYFLQDSWRVTPKLTVIYGIRHSILQAPYESKGQQIAPTVDTHAWFVKRAEDAAQGIPESQNPNDNLSFAPSGKANHRPGYWAKQKYNFAPRLSAAYALNPKTTIRAGAGMYFDHFGQGIVNSFDELGSFGLSSSIGSPAQVDTVQNTPRMTGPHGIPALAGCTAPASTVQYPFTPSTVPGCDFAATWGINSQLKTPYSYALDFSLQRELRAGFTLEANYVGRLGRHLLEQLDMAEPVNLVDAKGGGDYFTAARQLSKASDANGGAYGGGSTGVTPVHVQDIPYFDDVFPQMAGLDFVGETATDGLYNHEWAPYRYDFGETTSLQDVDVNCAYGCPKGTQFFSQQFSSLMAWSTIGTSSYHALQVILRHPSSHGLTVDFNYTLSKSLDIGSGAERSNEYATDAYADSGPIQNSWNPKANKAVSDFDTHHMVTLDWVYVVPVGHGKAVLGNSNRILDAVVGNWQWSGLSRWTSGLPFGVLEPGYTTNWQQEAFSVVTDRSQVKTARHLVGGIPQVFAGNEASTINGGIYTGSPIRLPYPGEAGQRNAFRGDGFFDIDSSLTKNWTLPDHVKLKFTGEVYNVGNNVRFDCSPYNLSNVLSQGSFGAYSGTLSTYRRMQFGLRLDF
jgi:hypothetical protein